ncbi:TraE/TraK family type IV conjugative transfer system protein [Psittacicella hinzii]|uniref:Conjugal transfer pilus assembly protein TraE n=1 Tax=Psittacicella hinzii TaxID=2028575 RepID=A0A3A1YL62_9GAMM|nr:TraE/TraK family type IV conjugative transfer system protein [Psittacicella hinzii]RIY36747.1 hypothetical protein CKF58_05725 [Psittacicella hinzii]
MKFATWNEKVKRLKSNTFLLLGSNVILALGLVFSVYSQLNTKPIIIVQPMITDKAVEIRASTLSRSYAISFATSMALLLGNITSDSMMFALESISQYVAPDYYAQFRKQLVSDMAKLKEKRMDMTFVSTKAYVDLQTGEVVVEGIASIIDAAGNRLNNGHQFRFLLDMRDYVPRIRAIQSLALAN